MKNFLINNNKEDGSSIFINRIREQDLSAEQKLNELKGFMEELARKAELKRIELERQAASCIDETLSQVELQIQDNEDYFTDDNQGVFANFFESLFNLFEVNVDPKVYKMLKEKKEKNLLLSIIKFLRDKLKELVKKIFKKDLDLSWDKRLDKEIKELQEKLLSGELSEEEFARVFERLQALTNLKFKLQMAVTGWIVTMFAEMFGVELAAIVEASTEEDKKAEKTSLKEENKEVYGNVEIKVDEREKPKVPVSLFEVSPGFVRPVPLSRPELDLLSNSLKGLMPPMFKEVNENLEVKEAKPKVEEEKKAKPEAPKVAVCPSKVPEKKPVASGIKIYSSKGLEKNINFEKCDTNTSVNGRGTTSTNKCGTTNDFKEKELKPTNEQNFDGKESKSPDKQKTDDSYAKLAKKVAERNARRSSANIKHDYPIDNWQAPSETNNNGKSSAASDAQPPKGLTNDVKVEKCVEGPSVGKT